jgi:hypothetical protein
MKHINNIHVLKEICYACIFMQLNANIPILNMDLYTYTANTMQRTFVKHSLQDDRVDAP